jgi:hypothetical protein
MGIIELIFSEEDVEDVLCDVVVAFEVLELLVEAWEDVLEVVSATLGTMALTFMFICRMLTDVTVWLLTAISNDVPAAAWF